MKEEIKSTPTIFMGSQLTGPEVNHKKKYLSELKGIFKDEGAFNDMDKDTIVYEVDAWCPVPNGTEGGLFFGLTHLYPGTVGNEYFMTHGHFHEVENRAEYYWGIEGEGALILMDANRNTWIERMYPGSLHYIPGFTGHRVANIGNTKLSFGACWPSDAGYKYDVVLDEGFSKRLFNIEGEPKLI